MCVACRQEFPRETLLRLTLTPDGVVLNLGPETGPESRHFQGRSAYVCREQTCRTQAIRGKKLQRALKKPIPDAIVKALESIPLDNPKS
ncbi:MAG: YlxR family protein [Cyanobacteria bacterium]|nr:YlxR family protein [Cyanobacteriota bacterium]